MNLLLSSDKQTNSGSAFGPYPVGTPSHNKTSSGSAFGPYPAGTPAQGRPLGPTRLDLIMAKFDKFHIGICHPGVSWHSYATKKSK